MILQIRLKNYSENQFKKQLAIACSILTIAFQSTTLPDCASAKNPKAATGRFISVEHPTVGQARIVQEGTKHYLVFDKTFRTLAGPDLFIILHRAAIPKIYTQKDYVLLGKLKNTAGEQRYEIPANVDPNAFQSVVIWCRQFSATFGYAKLTH
jgi:Electron transfer DM13